MIVTYAVSTPSLLDDCGLQHCAGIAAPPGRLAVRSPQHGGPGRGSRPALILYAAALTSNIRGWIANGVDSRRYATHCPCCSNRSHRAALSWLIFPTFAVVCGSGPGRSRLRCSNHYVGDDLYKQFAIVEWPIVYCCPPHQWWAAKQSALGPIPPVDRNARSDVYRAGRAGSWLVDSRDKRSRQRRRRCARGSNPQSGDSLRPSRRASRPPRGATNCRDSFRVAASPALPLLSVRPPFLLRRYRRCSCLASRSRCHDASSD